MFHTPHEHEGLYLGDVLRLAKPEPKAITYRCIQTTRDLDMPQGWPRSLGAVARGGSCKAEKHLQCT